jgi:hypothetical protein
LVVTMNIERMSLIAYAAAELLPEWLAVPVIEAQSRRIEAALPKPAPKGIRIGPWPVMRVPPRVHTEEEAQRHLAAFFNG